MEQFSQRAPDRSSWSVCNLRRIPAAPHSPTRAKRDAGGSRLPAQAQEHPAELPPVSAYTKGVMAEMRDARDRGLDVVGGNQPGAFELSRCPLVARAAHEIGLVKHQFAVVPAAVAGVIIDHPVGRREFVDRVSEAADQYDRGTRRPGEP